MKTVIRKLALLFERDLTRFQCICTKLTRSSKHVKTNYSPLLNQIVKKT